MRRSTPLVLATLVALAPLARPAAAREEPGSWIHLEVDEHKADGSKINLNLPLSAIDLILDLAHAKGIDGGHVRLEGHEVKVSEIRQVWQALKAAGDNELVRAVDGDGTVRIRQHAGRVLIDVHGRKGDKGKVNIEVPASAVDRLLGGDGETLDLRAALSQIGREGKGDVVRIEDGDTHVRIWIE